MKFFVALSIICFASFNSQGQTNYIRVCENCTNSDQYFDFNTTLDSSTYYLYFDTSQINNRWQVGNPLKSVFNSGYFNPSALVTDTINSYPINNSSSFQFSLVNCPPLSCGPVNYWGPSFQITHRMETDYGIDGGTIEVSHDNGATWANLIQDSINLPYISIGNMYTINDTVESLGKPGFSGSIGWDFIDVFYQPSYLTTLNDTITIRFTFASDSIQTNKDGWLIGVIAVRGVFETIKEINDDNLISIYPTPTSDNLHIDKSNKSEQSRLQVFNSTGQLIYDNFNFTEDYFNTKQLANGIYLLKYSDTINFTSKKMVVLH
jgi:Secretion system C-terminal sorting domain